MGGTKLTPLQSQSAVLEAANLERPQIARAIGASERSISKWRAMPQYSEEVARLRENHLGEVELLTARLRSKVITVVEKAVERLGEAMDANYKNTNPDWNTRLRAVEDAFNGALKLLDLGKDGGAGGGEAGTNIQATKIVVQFPDRTEPQGPPALEGSARPLD